MAFRRGFKSQCERRAVEVRRDLGLSKIAPLNAFDLARHYGITAWSTNDIIGLSTEDRNNLTKNNSDVWSALTIQIGLNHLIVYNAKQSVPRINSVVMHELSHIILGHEFANVCRLENGSLAPSNYNQDQEDEANWLGGTLLLPRPALLNIRRNNLDNETARDQYGVSEDMLNWRIRMTGVDFQIRHSQK